MLSIIITILMFLVMISLHEFGHFTVGKLLGFNVLEYAIGFGPAIFKKQGKKTLYSLRLIPFGGYCRFDGEDEEKEGVEGAFNEQKCWKRILVLIAGAVFNIILGMIIYVGLTVNVGEISTNKIEHVIENTSMYEEGILPGDEIVEIDGHKVKSYRDIQLYAGNMSEHVPVNVVVKRNNKPIEVNIIPTPQHVKVIYREDYIEYEETIGDKTTVSDIQYSDKNPYDADNVGKMKEQSRLLIGFSPIREKVTVFNIIPEAYNMTCFVVKLVYKSLYDLITGAVGIDAVSGPVGVVSEVSNAVREKTGRWLQVLNITALLTINLGVMNLLPLPALDGGRLLFVIIEWIRRKPVPRDKEGLIHGIGFAILFVFMLFILFQDIMKLGR